MPPTPGAGVHDDVIGLQSFAYYSPFTVDSRAIQYSVHYFMFFFCNNDNGFIRCAPIASMHHRLIRSTLQTFQLHSRWPRALNFRIFQEDPKGNLPPQLTLMTRMEPSPPGRWARSLCSSHPLGIFWPVVYHDISCTRLVVLAGLFVISPRLLIFMTGEPRTLLTPLEAFLAFQFGILLFAVSLGVIVNVREPSAISFVFTDTC